MLLLNKHGQSFWINHLRDALLFCHKLCRRKGCKYLALNVDRYLCSRSSSSSKVMFAPHQVTPPDWKGQQDSMEEEKNISGLWENNLFNVTY